MKKDLTLDEIISEMKKYREDNHLALVGNDAFNVYERLKDSFPKYLTVTIAQEEDIFTRTAYTIDTNRYSIKK